MFTTEELIAAADQIAAKTRQQLQYCRSRLVQGKQRSLDLTALRKDAERVERELQRIDLYRAVLNRGFRHAIMPEYVAARWSHNSGHRSAGGEVE